MYKAHGKYNPPTYAHICNRYYNHIQLSVIAAVLKMAMTQALTPDVVKGGFKSTGLFPLDRTAIDPSKLIADTTVLAEYVDHHLDVPLLMECCDGGEGFNILSWTIVLY